MNGNPSCCPEGAVCNGGVVLNPSTDPSVNPSVDPSGSVPPIDISISPSSGSTATPDPDVTPTPQPTPTVTSTPSPDITPTPSPSSDSCPNNTNSFAISSFTNSISEYELKNLKSNSSFSTKSIDISRTIQFLNELKNVTNKKQLLEVIKKYKDVISELKTFRRFLQIINIIENIRDCAVIYDVMNQVTESLKNLQDARNKLESKDCYASNSDKSKYLNRISAKEYQIYDNLEKFFKEMSIKFIPIIQLIEASQPYINNIKSFYQDSISFLNLMDKACECSEKSFNSKSFSTKAAIGAFYGTSKNDYHGVRVSAYLIDKAQSMPLGLIDNIDFDTVREIAKGNKIDERASLSKTYGGSECGWYKMSAEANISIDTSYKGYLTGGSIEDEMHWYENRNANIYYVKSKVKMSKNEYYNLID